MRNFDDQDNIGQHNLAAHDCNGTRICTTASGINAKVSEEIRKKNFVYRGEGNESIVVALPKLRKVLRIKKCPSDHIAESQKCNHLILLQKIWYQKKVMQPLLGNAFFEVPDIICIPSPILITVSSQIESFRPSDRKHKHIDVRSAHALLMPDACMFNHHNDNDTFAVEVKPKQGFLSKLATIDAYCNELKGVESNSTCRYSLKQACKLKKRQIKEKSEYCPVDLFSGCPNRMKQALMALLKNPQNNLKVFKNGMKIYSPGSTTDELESAMMPPGKTAMPPSQNRFTNWFCDFLIKALTHNAGDKQIIQTKKSEQRSPEYCFGHRNSKSPSAYCSDCQHSLPSGSVLDKVLSIQRLDTQDISGIYPMYIKIKKMLREIESNNLLKHEVNYSNAINYAINKVNEFLIAATAKDCSIIVKFQQVSNNLCNLSYPKEGVFHVNDVNGQCFQVTVKVVDLDPKGPERIEKYFLKDRDMKETTHV